MPVGSHKDAFKAHQLVKKLVAKEANTILAAMAGDVLLDFVKSQRQINLRGAASVLPPDTTAYDPEKVSAALQAVGSLCGLCEEAHDDACFVNQARRVLIAAKTGIDLGLQFDGKKSLDDLIAEAERLSAAKRQTEKSQAPASSSTSSESPQLLPSEQPGAGENTLLHQELETLREKDIFRSTLIDEVVATIKKVADGNYAAEMPVHEDEQLGKLATSFNIMLKAMQATMSHLDQLVNARNAELKHIMNTVPVGLLSLNAEFRINPEHSRSAERMLGVEGLRGRDFLDLLGLTNRRGDERKALKDYLELLQMGIVNPDMDRLNPCPELQLPKGGWVRLQYHFLNAGVGGQDLLVEMEDISETKRLIARVEATQRESDQIKAIAEAPDLFRDFLDDIRKILDHAEISLDGLETATDNKDRVNDMFRGVHTIKGVSGSFGMIEVGRHAAALEDALGRAREQEKLTSVFVTDIHDGLKRLEEAVAETKKISTLILGDESAISGPVLRIPLTNIKQLERLVRKSELSEGFRTDVAGKLRELQQIPAKKGLERTTRLVPGLISRLEKSVNFCLKGEEIPIHYELAQELNGPLAHLLRNAFDHGVEGAEQRVAAGKQEQGCVTVSVRQIEHWLEISVEDDGKGLDPEILRASAVRKGILSPESAKGLSEDECRKLIFRPGFSTTESVSDVSGRGVGMDVVQTTISKLGGDITIDSTPGVGSRFTLRVPSVVVCE
ncbi:MAG: Hpt domain-containing protein [Candidatus Riflebacteria bacterium]|nr:Hpt domain-containing protein [Candidatus Riflebacteria bacterium]